MSCIGSVVVVEMEHVNNLLRSTREDPRDNSTRISNIINEQVYKSTSLQSSSLRAWHTFILRHLLPFVSCLIWTHLLRLKSQVSSPRGQPRSMRHEHCSMPSVTTLSLDPPGRQRKAPRDVYSSQHGRHPHKKKKKHEQLIMRSSPCGWLSIYI